MSDVIYILWSCCDEKEAKPIIYKLLEKHFIACASILPGIISIYHWKEKIEETKEIKVILKTVKDHFDLVQKYIQSHCSYEIPEIVQIDIAQGNASYLSWVSQTTKNAITFGSPKI